MLPLYSLTESPSIFQGTLINAAVWTNIAIVFMWTVGFLLSNIFQCWPISINWATTGVSTWGSCVDNVKMTLAQHYSDIFTDCRSHFTYVPGYYFITDFETVLILALPIPCVGRF